MLLYAGTRTNQWLENNGKSTLLLMGGEVPATVKDLSGQYAHDLIKTAVSAIEVNSRSNGRFTQFMHGRMIKRPNFYNDKGIFGLKDVCWAAKKHGTYFDKTMANEFNMSQHYSRLFYDIEADRSGKEYNFGTESGSNYALIFEMEKAVHAVSLKCAITFASSTFYGHVWGGRITPTDFTQVDNTLDLSGATEGQTVRIRDAKNLPSALVGVSGIFNGVVLTFTSGVWVTKGLEASFEWVKANAERFSVSSFDNVSVLDDAAYVAGNEKFEFYKMESDGSSSWGLKGKYIGFECAADDLPDYPNLAKQTITWGIIIPQVDDSSSAITYKSFLTNDAPMFMMDAGLPNSGAAATINNTVDVDHTTDITLMNLKVAVNWMAEEQA